MQPKRSDLFKNDASDRERAALDQVLTRKVSEALVTIPRVSIKAARSGATQLEIVSDRDTTRLLFISRDTSLLNQSTQSLDGYLDLADVFDEVHIVVLQPGIKTRNPVLRVSSNVWLYVVSTTHWWWSPFAAIQLIESQLMFADGFRADLIVARDPYESAIVARYLGRHYHRPTQLHVLEDITSARTQQSLPHAFVRRVIARIMVPLFPSIRTSTDVVAVHLLKRYPAIPDIATLPRFHNYQRSASVPGHLTLKDKYPHFSFIIVYRGALDSESRAYQAMDAVRGMLRNKKIGLIICGEGKARVELEKRALLLGITEQVAFERVPEDGVSFLAGADVLVVPDITAASDEVVVLGAFAGVPVVATITPQRSDLFVHGESALLCAQDNVMALGTLVGQIANDALLRHSLSEAAYTVVNTRLHEDPVAYQAAYRDSVEAALFAGDTALLETDDNEGVASIDAV